MSDLPLDTIVCSDALVLMKNLPDASIDAIFSDPPYNMTNLDFETAIDWAVFWCEARRILKRKNSPVILFSQQPFTTDLICSNRKGWRYEIIWHKSMPVGYLDANRRPLRCHENIQVFGDELPEYFPQMQKAEKYRAVARRNAPAEHYNKAGVNVYVDDGTRYPRSVWTYAQRDSAFENTKTLHPTQKPLDLMIELILTYSQAGEIILDPFIGSGSTAVAARNIERHWIGCDADPKWVDVATTRLHNTDPFKSILYPDGSKQLSLFPQGEV